MGHLITLVPFAISAVENETHTFIVRFCIDYVLNRKTLDVPKGNSGVSIRDRTVAFFSIISFVTTNHYL